MAKKIEWRVQLAKDREVVYEDVVSKDGHWLIAEGFDEYARKRLKQPFTLFYRHEPNGRVWKTVDTFPSIKAAKASAQEESE